jgi:hypothetical protein
VITDSGYTQAGQSRQARVLLRPLAALMPCILWPELAVSRRAAELRALIVAITRRPPVVRGRRPGRPWTPAIS